MQFLISYQLLNKPLLYVQVFIFNTFHIVSPILKSLSHENAIENSLISKKVPQQNLARWMCEAMRFISREKQIFLVGFSLIFTSLPRKFKNQLNTRLVICRIMTSVHVYFLLFHLKTFFSANIGRKTAHVIFRKDFEQQRQLMELIYTVKYWFFNILEHKTAN